MTEVRKESLSALLDGEASEIEVHRLVREFRDDDSLTTSWTMYQQIRTTVRSESQLEPEHHSALFARISQAVENEDAHSDASAVTAISGSRRKGAVVGSLALAASLVIAVFVGIQVNDDQLQTGIAGLSPNQSQSQSLSQSPSPSTSPAALTALPSDRSAISRSVPNVQLVSNAAQGLTTASSADLDRMAEVVTPELIELDEEKQRLLRAYLNQHDRMSRMNTQQQFVNHSDSAK